MAAPDLPGLKPVSRFQLLFAILMYLGSPAWMAMMAIGTVALALSETQTGRAAPVELGAGALAVRDHHVHDAFAPKIATVIDVLFARTRAARFGGAMRSSRISSTETLFMLLLAPISGAGAHVLHDSPFRVSAWRRAGTASRAKAMRCRGGSRCRKLWPQTLAGCLVLGVVLPKAPETISRSR